MKVRISLYTLLFVLLFLLEYVMTPFSFNGVSPQYLLCAVVSLAMLENRKVSTLFGLFAGLAVGFCAGEPFGVSALIFVAIGYFLGRFMTRSLAASFYTCAAVCLSVVLVRDVVTCLIRIATGSATDFFQILYRVTLPKLLMTIPASLVIYLVVFGVRRCRLWRNIDEEY